MSGLITVPSCTFMSIYLTTYRVALSERTMQLDMKKWSVKLSNLPLERGLQTFTTVVDKQRVKGIEMIEMFKLFLCE